MTFKTLKGYFRLKMMAELVENAPVCSLFPLIKNYKMSEPCVIPFGLREGKTGNLGILSLELYIDIFL